MTQKAQALPEFTLGQLQALTGATLIGDANQIINDVCHPLKITNNKQMALILDKGILPAVENATHITNAIVPLDIDLPNIPNQLKVARPKLTLAQLLAVIAPKPFIEKGIHASAVIHPTAQVDESANIGPNCTVGANTKIGKGSQLIANVFVGSNVSVGENALFYAGVCIGDGCQIGNNVILHHNASIGADGFSFITPEEGSIESAQKSKDRQITKSNTAIIKVASAGIVKLEDNVEIGANACVDRATLGETVIGENTKIDNLVQIGHNCILGNNILIAGLTGVAGSVKISNGVVIGGGAGIKDNIQIGEDAIIAPLAGITQSVEAKTTMIGAPAVPAREFLNKEFQVKKWVKNGSQRIKDLEEKLAQLEAKLEILEKHPVS